MSKHNYSQYSKRTDNVVEEQNVIQPVEIIVDKPVTEVKMEPVVVEPTVEPAKPVAPKPVVGTVFNCGKLNVRSEPASDADIICVLDANSEVKIDMSRSTKEWYKICTAAGVDGFCMRKFVKR